MQVRETIPWKIDLQRRDAAGERQGDAKAGQLPEPPGVCRRDGPAAERASAAMRPRRRTTNPKPAADPQAIPQTAHTRLCVHTTSAASAASATSPLLPAPWRRRPCARPAARGAEVHVADPIQGLGPGNDHHHQGCLRREGRRCRDAPDRQHGQQSRHQTQPQVVAKREGTFGFGHLDRPQLQLRENDDRRGDRQGQRQPPHHFHVAQLRQNDDDSPLGTRCRRCCQGTSTRRSSARRPAGTRPGTWPFLADRQRSACPVIAIAGPRW